MQKIRVTTQKMPDFTQSRASSVEAQVERMPTAPADGDGVPDLP